MATNSKKSLQDLAEVFEDEPAVNVKRMSGQMDKAKANRLAKKEAKAKERAEGALMAAKFEQAVVAKIVKTKKVPAPKVEPEQVVKMVTTTLEEVAKVVKPHAPVVLPAELSNVGSIPEFAALIEAAKLKESAFDADQTYQAKLEVKRWLEKDQRQFSPRYNEMFSEQMTTWLNEPGQEWRKTLNPKEQHVKKLRMWVSSLINKAIASQDESAAEYLKLDEQLEEVRSWLAIHIADKDENEFKSKQALSKIGAKYEDVFIS